MTKYSSVALAVDLIINEYKITNPVLIAEKIQDDLDMDVSIHAISDYLAIADNYETESAKIHYSITNN
jgi:hypothetical protein